MRVIQTKLAKAVQRVSFGEQGAVLAVTGRYEVSLHYLTAENSTRLNVGSFGCSFAATCSNVGSLVVMAPGKFTIYDTKKYPAERVTIPEVSGQRVCSFALSACGGALVHSVATGGENPQLSLRNSVAARSIAVNGSVAKVWQLPASQSFVFIVLAVSQNGEKTAIRERGVHPNHHDVLSLRLTMSSIELIRIDLTSYDFRDSFRITFSPTAAELIGWNGRDIIFWTVSDGREFRRVTYPGRAYLTDLRYHPSGKFFITVGGDRLVRYWDAKSYEVTKTLKWDIGKLTCLDISPDGTLAAAGSDSGKVIVWDVDE